jgi:transcriptional regulator with PAS, ATPase and Fis domain
MDPLAQILGDSPGIVAVREKIRRLVQRQADSRRLPPILIQGETGTGKGLLAHTLHGASPRAAAAFVDVNCAAIPETLLEAEMFGYERGAFTDARQPKPGLFQTAHKGTIFLDEVGLLPEGLQAKLLKVLEDQAVRRLGSTRSEPVDVWIVAATSENLAVALRTRRFREDLYHRLAVVTIVLPPLRDRGTDVLRLAEHFLARACADYGLPAKTFSPEATAALVAYPWPGNLRELANVMERVALLGEARRVMPEMLGLPSGPATEPGRRFVEPETRERAEPARDAERDQLLDVLRETSWNVSRAATRLGLTRNTLRYRLEKHRLTPPKGRTESDSKGRARDAAAPPAAELVPAVPAPRLPPVVRWERRPVTLLSAVLLGPATGASLAEQSRALGLLVDKAESFGGRIAALGHTALHASFGLEPTVAGEDAPSRAAHAAMAMQRAVETARASAPERPALKVALHTGPVLVTRVGDTVAIERDAEREAWGVLEALVATAAPGAILATEGAATFLERGFELVRVKPPGSGYRLAGPERPGLGVAGRLAKLVGRESELALLESRWAEALRGHGQAVGIVGEAGVGKSRLVHEFRRVVRRRGALLIRSRCAAYSQGAALVPILDLVRALARIRSDDPSETARAKLERMLGATALPPVHRRALLEVLGLQASEHAAPEERRRAAFEALAALGLAGTTARPIVIVVEDLQWIDRSSEEFLAGFLPRIETAAVMFVVTHRPEYTPPWASRPFYTRCPVQELGEAQAAQLLDGLLPASVPEETRRTILERARGNPFYLEEQAHATVEAGGVRPSEGVPDTIQGVILARIDRLPERARRVLQTASVLGREVSLRVLATVWSAVAGAADRTSGDPGLELATLVRHGFLSERTGADAPVYLFKQALTQEVAYGSLSGPERQALHAAAGRVLEALYADRLHEVYDRLAHHYARTDRSDRAVLFLTRFAKQATALSAHAEAVAALQEAHTHAERLPVGAERDRRLVDLVLRQARSLFFLGRSPEGLALLLGQRSRLSALADPELAGRYHFLLARHLSLVGDQAGALQHAERAIAEASRCGDEATLARATYVLAFGAYWAGRPGRAIELARDAIARLERSGERVWRGQAEWVVGVSQAFRGEFDDALATLAGVEARGQALGDARLVSYAAATIGEVRAVIGEWVQGVQDCRRGVERSPDPLNHAFAVGCLGHACLEQGDVAAAIPLLEESRRQLRQFGFRQMEGLMATWLGEARLAAGEVDAARGLAEAALATARAGGYAAPLGFAQRLAGRVLRAEQRLDDAAVELSGALEAFAGSEARFEVARTHLDLAELAHARGDHARAASHVTAAAAGFGELRVPTWSARAADLAARLSH